MLYLNSKLTEVVKMFEKAFLFCPAELGSLELTGAQLNCVGFSSLTSTFWSFLRRDLLRYVCVCVLDGSHFKFLSVYRVGWFLHTLRRGWVVNTLAQWIKDAFCPVGVTICLNKLLYFENREGENRNANTQQAVRSRCFSWSWMLCQCRRQTVYSKKLFLTELTGFIFLLPSLSLIVFRNA